MNILEGMFTIIPLWISGHISACFKTCSRSTVDNQLLVDVMAFGELELGVAGFRAPFLMRQIHFYSLLEDFIFVGMGLHFDRARPDR